MSKTHTIPLAKPIVGHEVVRELEFREPKWRDFMEFGPAYRWMPRGDGMVVAVADHEAIRQYAERCLVKPTDALGTLAQVELADAHRIVELFMGFFRIAEDANAASKTSSATSSSNSDGAPETSPT